MMQMFQLLPFAQAKSDQREQALLQVFLIEIFSFNAGEVCL
jgi:hypothetical protein